MNRYLHDDSGQPSGYLHRGVRSQILHEFGQGPAAPHMRGRRNHIGGLVGIFPIVVLYFNRPDKAREATLAHLALTHPGSKMETAGSLMIDVLLKVLGEIPLKESILGEIGAQKNPLLGHPFLKWLNDPDEWVIGPRFSTACYVEDSVPAVIYLALKFHDDPEKVLIVNTNLGGDNAARGSVLGALLGAAFSVEQFPDRWVQGLLEPLPDLLSP